MKTVSEILQDADPLRHESQPADRELDRLRRAVVKEASDAPAPASAWFLRPVVLLAIVALIVAGLVAAGAQVWSQGCVTLQAAAVRFEIRLAEDHSAPGLREARVSDSGDLVYVHPEAIVTNADIAQSRIVPGDDSSHFGVSVEFTADGAEKMRQATEGRVGGLVAILIDGEVIMAPVVRAPISNVGLISGHYTHAEAERIMNGIAR